MKLMSLFDGSGGFPLAASLCGIEPVYASEVEPYPIAVTKNRFPNMKHLGDVSRIKGAELEPVDIITFGSPCQDLSVAGKRAGLRHTAVGDDETTRSGLFMEAIRIIKEMRAKTNGFYPRFAVWENVPGAFSSNRGEDFRLVLEEFVKITEPDAVMPDVPQAGWAYADCISGDGWSIAYRVFDAQYWGVPQRRRRIYLVADFRGECAGKILFERKGLRGYFEAGRTPWQGIAADAQNCAGADDRAGESGLVLDDQGGQQISVRTDGKSPTLRAEAHGNVPCVINKKALVYDARGNGDGQIVNTITGNHNNRITDYTALCIEEQPVYCLQGNGIDRADTAGCNGKGWREDKCYTLNTIDRPAVVYAMQAFGKYAESEKAGALKRRDYKDATDLVLEEKPIVLDRAFFNQGKNAKYDPQYYTDGICPTLVARGPAAVQARYIVRRLTPTECARLQGFPDLWGHFNTKENLTDEEHKFWLEVRNTHAAINGKQTKGYTKPQILSWYNKLHTDSSEYKMWGNGIALPNALYVMQGIEQIAKGDNR